MRCKPAEQSGRTPRGYDLTLLRELQELSPAERLERNWRMAELVEELKVAGEKARATERDLPSSR